MMAPFNPEEPSMNKPISPAAGSVLRQRFIEDMTVRGFSEKTRRGYIRIVAGFAALLGRSPDTATAEDIRRFQVHQSELGMRAPAMDSTVAALRFFLTHTLDRPDLSRKLMRLRYPRKLPVVLSAEEVARCWRPNTSSIVPPWPSTMTRACGLPRRRRSRSVISTARAC
jgi:site-specific recombinase XerD